MGHPQLIIKAVHFPRSEEVLAFSPPPPSFAIVQMSNTIPKETLDRFRQTASSLTPQLLERHEAPRNVIRFEPDSSIYLRYKPQVLFPVQDLDKRLWEKGEELIIDFESHRTGYFSFHLAGEGDSVGDAPTRLRLVFGEVPGDVVEEFDPAKSKVGCFSTRVARGCGGRVLSTV